MRKPNSIQVQDFLLVIASQSSLFTLEAEHEPTGRVFTLNLDGDSLGQVTNGLFNDADNMVQGLKEAAENNSENIKLEISLEGKLTYTVVFTSGVIKKEFSFTLNLVEKKMDPIQILSRRLDDEKRDIEEWKDEQEKKTQTFETKIESIQGINTARVDELENIVIKTDQNLAQRFEKLENMVIQMEQRMAQRLEKLENLCENLKASVPLKVDISFTKTSENASRFNLTDNGKTATLIVEAQTGLRILPQVPSCGQYSYSLRINHYTQKLGLGIQSKDTKTHYLFLAWDGHIEGALWKQGKEKGSFGNTDSILKMIVDMDQGTLAFSVNHIFINSCSISKSDRYFAFVYFGMTGNHGDSVTLL